MCVVSMVHDHYLPLIPAVNPAWLPNVTQPLQANWFVELTPSLKAEIDEMRKLISEFREAVAAAKRVDALTGQPNCVDPEKAKLEARVAELESQLSAVREAVSPKAEQ